MYLLHSSYVFSINASFILCVFYNLLWQNNEISLFCRHIFQYLCILLIVLSVLNAVKRDVSADGTRALFLIF